MICRSVLPETYDELVEPDYRKVTLSFLHAYGSDWEDLCTKGSHGKACPKNVPEAGHAKPPKNPKNNARSMFPQNDLTGSADRNK